MAPQKISKKLLLPVLFLIMMQWTGAIYFYDFPQLFESQLITKFAITSVEVSMLYSFASIPNIFSNMLGAWFLQKVGLGISVVLFSSQVFIGTLICFYGIYINDFKYLLIGRVFFGIGFGLTFLSQTISTERWFNGRFMTLAYGLNRSCVYLFQAVSTFIQPVFLVKSRGFEFPMFMYSVVSFFCFLSSAIFSILHIKNKQLLKRVVTKEQEEEKKKKKNQEESCKLKDFRHIRKISWAIAFTIAMTSNCYYQIMNFTTDMLVKRYGFDFLQAKDAVAIVPISSMIGIPIFGALFNKYGGKGFGLFLSGVLALATFVMMTMVPYGCDKIFVYAMLSMMSLFRSVYTGCSWSCLVISLPRRASTNFVAFGFTLQNVLMAVLPLVFGKINYMRDYAAYQNSLYLLIGMATICIFLSGGIFFSDVRSDKLLHLPENNKIVQDMKRKRAEEFDRKIKGEEKKSKTDLEENLKEEEDTITFFDASTKFTNTRKLSDIIQKL